MACNRTRARCKWRAEPAEHGEVSVGPATQDENLICARRPTLPAKVLVRAHVPPHDHDRPRATQRSPQRIERNRLSLPWIAGAGRCGAASPAPANQPSGVPVRSAAFGAGAVDAPRPADHLPAGDSRVILLDADGCRFSSAAGKRRRKQRRHVPARQSLLHEIVSA